MAPSAGTAQLKLRMHGDAAGGVAPHVEVRVGGQAVAQLDVAGATFADYTVTLPAALAAGNAVDLVFTNAGYVGTETRVLYVSHLRSGNAWLVPTDPGVVFDRGQGAAATDGQDTVPGKTSMYEAGALRFTWPAQVPGLDAGAGAAVRFLQQASFGATLADAEAVLNSGPDAWVTQQIALPYDQTYVDAVQARQDQGAAWVPPDGAQYRPDWVVDDFWRTAAYAPDQLRRRVAFALQQIIVVSLSEGELYANQRAYARYLDMLAEGAFGNYRQLLENMALSPAMGIFLSHMRNQKPDPATGRQPDENFAREVMQLFTIGLYELNMNGTLKLTGGQPVETYNNADVQSLARIFTGWSWAFDETGPYDFEWRNPDYGTTGSARVDLRPMRNWPDYHATDAVTLFPGKSWAVNIPAGRDATKRLRLALDGLFNHPNVAPFISRQLIQRLITSNPSPAYVGRVAAVFANNGRGTRGDMAAVVRAVLMDSEARAATPPSTFGKLTEPVVATTQWMRAFGVESGSGKFLMPGEAAGVGEHVFYQSSVFNYYRPGYVAPNTALAAAGLGAPEFQIANESTVANWINRVLQMSSEGVGWNGSGPDVHAVVADEVALAALGAQRLVERLNLLLFAGRMSDALRIHLYDAMAGVGVHASESPDPNEDRTRVAMLIALAAPEYLVQR